MSSKGPQPSVKALGLTMSRKSRRAKCRDTGNFCTELGPVRICKNSKSVKHNSVQTGKICCVFFFFKNIPFNHQALGNSVERSPHGCLFNKEGGLQDDNEPESQVSDI